MRRAGRGRGDDWGEWCEPWRVRAGVRRLSPGVPAAPGGWSASGWGEGSVLITLCSRFIYSWAVGWLGGRRVGRCRHLVARRLGPRSGALRDSGHTRIAQSSRRVSPRCGARCAPGPASRFPPRCWRFALGPNCPVVRVMRTSGGHRDLRVHRQTPGCLLAGGPRSVDPRGGLADATGDPLSCSGYGEIS